MPSFKEFMSSPDGVSNFDSFFDTLSDLGIDASNNRNEFLECEYAEDNMWELSYNLVEYGFWMNAKFRGYEVLRDKGIDWVKSNADACEAINDTVGSGSANGGTIVSGEWCRWNGIIFVLYNGQIDVTNAVEVKLKRDRDRWDKERACDILRDLYLDSRESIAA